MLYDFGRHKNADLWYSGVVFTVRRWMGENGHQGGGVITVYLSDPDYFLKVAGFINDWLNGDAS